MEDKHSWRTPRFRQHIITRIENVAREVNQKVTTAEIHSMECNIYEAARDREEYLELSAKLVLKLREAKRDRFNEDFNRTSRQRSPERRRASFNEIPSLLKINITAPNERNQSLARNQSEELRWEDRSSYPSRFREPERPRYEDERDLSWIQASKSDQDRRQTVFREDQPILYPGVEYSGFIRDRDDRGLSFIPPGSVLDRDERSTFERTGRDERSTFERRVPPRNPFERDAREERRSQGTADRKDPVGVGINARARLSGAARRKLRRMTDRGMSYEVALQKVGDTGPARNSRQAGSNKPIPPQSKRPLLSTPRSRNEPPAKKPFNTTVSSNAAKRKETNQPKTTAKPSARNVPPGKTSLSRVDPSNRNGQHSKTAPSKPAPAKSAPSKTTPLKAAPSSKNGTPSKALKKNDKFVKIAFVKADQSSESTPKNETSAKAEPAKVISKPVTPVVSTNAVDFEVGIVDKEYPKVILSRDRLQALQQAVIRAIEDIPDDGPQVRFLDCTYHPGTLLLKCADKESRDWVVKNVEFLRPWEGVQLKVLLKKSDMKPLLYSALIPDDIKSTKLAEEVVLTRLKKMNHGLLTESWAIVQCEPKISGHVYTFSIDNESFKVLKDKLEMKPYFGFGRVEFRLVK